MKKIKFVKIVKAIAAAIAIILFATAIPMTAVEAKGETWRHPGNGWHYLEGTDISVQIEDGTVRIHGTGAIPDYDYWTLYERPWDKVKCQALFIDDTITSIGKYAFYNMKDLKYIFISTKTFIADVTTFDAISYRPIYRISSRGETVKMIGTIPFTSLDSIKRIAQSNRIGASYIFDTPAAARSFQESTNPTILNVYCADDQEAPWSKEDDGNGGVQTSICKITTPGASNSYGVSAEHLYQGDACYEAYAAFIGDYTFATTFNIEMTNGGKILERTDSALQYTLSIPKEYRFAGRAFRLLAIGRGVMNIYDDIDADDTTITFTTDTPTTSYALVYK